MIVAVFDANVLASGFAGYTIQDSPPGELMRRWRHGAFSMVVSEEIFSELEHDAFAKPYFRRRVAAQADILAALRRHATLVEISVDVQGIAPDRDDNHVLAAALSSQAAYIVTGDKPLQSLGTYQGVALVSPRAFLEILEG